MLWGNSEKTVIKICEYFLDILRPGGIPTHQYRMEDRKLRVEEKLTIKIGKED